LDAQRRIAELEAAHAAEVARSHRLEQQIGQLLEQLTVLTQRVAELTERLGQNSRNSHLPPSSDPPGAAGLAEVSRAGYPDGTQFDPQSDYYDAGSKPDDPRWFMVDIKFTEKFSRFVPLEELRAAPALKDMVLLRRGSRLSVQPVTSAEWKAIVALGRRKS
jgi:hypothetical protein